MGFDVIEKLAAALSEDIDAIIGDNRIDPKEYEEQALLPNGLVAIILPIAKLDEINPHIPTGSLLLLDLEGELTIAEYDILEEARLLTEYALTRGHGTTRSMSYRAKGPEWYNGVVQMLGLGTESKCDIVGRVLHLSFPDNH